MLPLGPVTSSAGTTYSASQVFSLLFGSSLQLRWFFDLLDPYFVYKADLSPNVDWNRAPEISHDTTRAVMRQLRLTLRYTASANVFQDLIRVRFGVIAPDGGWLEWQVGIFMMTPPDREVREEATWWTMTAPDLNQLLVDAGFPLSFALQGGVNYAQGVRQQVRGYGGATPLDAYVSDFGTVLPATFNWDAGSSRLKAINDLLGAIAYSSAHMRGNLLVSRPIPDYNLAIPNLTLDSVSGGAVIIGPFPERTDYSGAYNQIQVIGEDPRRQPITPPLYENRRPDSPTSILNWHPRLKVIKDSTVADMASAMAKQRVEAQAAARIYSTLTVGTIPFPFLGDRDVVRLTYSAADEGTVSRNFLCLGFTHPCALAPTTMLLQRLVAA